MADGGRHVQARGGIGVLPRDLRAAGYAYLESVPERFWTRASPGEIEYAGKVQPGRLTNLGAIRRRASGLA